MEDFVTKSIGYYPRQYNRLMRLFPEDLELFLSKLSVAICGGAIRSVFTNEEISDYDLYPLDNGTGNKVVSWMKDQDDFIKVSDTANATTFKVKKSDVLIQVIKNKYIRERPEISDIAIVASMLNKFDFTVCMAGYLIKDQQFVLYNRFLEDLAERRLVFNANTDYPVCSLHRTIKYQNKGFKLDPVESVKIALAIAKLEISSYEDLKDQLMGIDTLIFEELTDDLIMENGKDYAVDYNTVIDAINNKLNDLWDEDSPYRNNKGNIPVPLIDEPW